MPGMDGFAVADALRADPATSGIPVVILTAKAMTPGDKDRLHGRIAHVAQKGTVPPSALVELVRRATEDPAPLRAGSGGGRR
jgi:CheY-like chemotaxis protein